jgi:transposase-like protein
VREDKTGSDRVSVMLVMCPSCEATSFRLLSDGTPAFTFRCTGCSSDYENPNRLPLHDTGMIE